MAIEKPAAKRKTAPKAKKRTARAKKKTVKKTEAKRANRKSTKAASAKTVKAESREGEVPQGAGGGSAPEVTQVDVADVLFTPPSPEAPPPEAGESAKDKKKSPKRAKKVRRKKSPKARQSRKPTERATAPASEPEKPEEVARASEAGDQSAPPPEDTGKPARTRRGRRGGKGRSRAKKRVPVDHEEDSTVVEAESVPAPTEADVREPKAAPIGERDLIARVEAAREPARDRKARPSRRDRKGRREKAVKEPKAPPSRARKAKSASKEAPVDVVSLDEEDAKDQSADGKTREMIINVSAGDECRIAVLENGRLEELFIERESAQSLVGNIYKGRITNVEPSIQAVFIDFGHARNGFLHISDVQPQYFPNRRGETEDVGRKIPRHSRPPIQECFRRGQEAIVQVTKAGVGTKGPTLTTYLSIPGRFLVMMPGMSQLGVSRKIEDEEARRKMRKVLNELNLPQGMGFILRTAGLDRTKRDLQRDLNYLMRLWKTVAQRVKQQPAPAELYRESDLVTRTIRDVYASDFRRLVVDDAETAEKAREFLSIAMPRLKPNVSLYTAREPLFHRFGLESEIEKINMRQVPLPSGGSIVIDTTEAMVAIDVNSGRFRSPVDAEETALRINLEAAEEIGRQLRLRDLGGLVVCDFIDMRFERNKREVERTIRDALKKHKERARILRMSAFGLIEITRQRRGPSIKRNLYLDCKHCKGTGLVKMPASVVLDVMRIVQLAAHREDVSKVTVTVSGQVAFQILNSKRAVLHEIETETGTTVIIRGDDSVTVDEISFRCEDSQGRLVKFLTSPEETGGGRHP
jgi:ribonuclease E